MCGTCSWWKILAPPDNSANWTAIGLMTVGHLAVLGFVWKLAEKWAGVVSLAFFLAAVGVGAYEHFLGPVPTNVFRVAAGRTGTLFDVTVYVLTGLELLGCWLGGRLLTGQATHRAHSDPSAHSA